MPMLRYGDVAELVRIIDSSSCAELILDTSELKLVVRRHGADGQAAASAGQQSSAMATQPAAPADPEPQPAQSPTPAQQPRSAAAGGTHRIVEAPMIGTFYRAPSPGAPAFVEPGSRVEADDRLCLIEVMKLYTTIYAPTAGIVREICAGDGELVEYGQALFIIEPV